MDKLTIEARRLFGSRNDGLRKEMIAAGCKFDPKAAVWVFPDEATRGQFLPRIPGGAPTQSTQPVARPAARPVAAPATVSPVVAPPLERIPAPMAQAPEPVAKTEQPAPTVSEPAPLPPPPLLPRVAALTPALEPAPEPPPRPPMPQADLQPDTPERRAPVRILTFPPSLVVCGAVEVIHLQGSVKYTRIAESVESTDVELADTVVAALNEVAGAPSGGDEVPATQRVEERVRTSKRTCVEPDEEEKARVLAQELRLSVRRYGVHSLLGPICPLDKRTAIEDIVMKARERATEWNRSACYHHVRVTYLLATMAGEEEQAARVVAFDIQQALGEMRSALQETKPDELVRRARNAAVRVKRMSKDLAIALSTSQQKMLLAAVEEARAAANLVVAETKEKTGDVEKVLKAVSLRAVDTARFEFGKYAIPEDMEAAQVASGASTARFAGLDLGLDDVPPPPLRVPSSAAAADRPASLNRFDALSTGAPE